MNRDLHTFVRDALSRGVSREQLRAALREAHWPADEIDSELAGWHDAGLGLPVPRRRVGVSAREAFLYLLLFVALYLVCFHAGAILFALIEWQWPDAMLRGLPGRHWDGVRFSVATLLVAFPVYVVTSRFVGRSYEADPEQQRTELEPMPDARRQRVDEELDVVCDVLLVGGEGLGNHVVGNEQGAVVARVVSCGVVKRRK